MQELCSTPTPGRLTFAQCSCTAGTVWLPECEGYAKRAGRQQIFPGHPSGNIPGAAAAVPKSPVAGRRNPTEELLGHGGGARREATPKPPALCFADQNADKKLTLSEFISLPVGTVENQQAQDIDDDWVKDRKKEFEEVIDADRDGIVTMEELEVGALGNRLLQAHARGRGGCLEFRSPCELYTLIACLSGEFKASSSRFSPSPSGSSSLYPL